MKPPSPFKLDMRDQYWVLCARRNGGKTELLKYLLRKQKHLFKECFIVSPTAFTGTWKGIVEDRNIQHSFDEEWMMRLINKMISINQGKTKHDPGFTRVALILDDVVSSDRRCHGSKSLSIISSRGRHCGLFLCRGRAAPKIGEPAATSE
jgi:hypothetical protein